jgi:GAF domain-containing protein
VDGLPHDGLDAGREALRRFLAGDDDLQVMLTKVALLATETVPGCDFASITRIGRQGPTTPVYTDEAALALDEVQYGDGDGPCLAAIRHHGPEHCTTATDTRWPAFVDAALRHDVSAVLSTPLVDGEASVGSLNMYSRTVERYDDDAQRCASLFADQLGVAAAKVTMYAESYELARQLQEAMESRAEIEQAKGILMAAERCSADDAFAILVRASQHQNRKLRAIATEIVERYSAPPGSRS